MTLPKLNDLASQFLDFMRTIDSKFEKYDEECVEVDAYRQKQVEPSLICMDAPLTIS